MIGFGDELGERLMRVGANCRSCGRSFTFEEGGRCSRSNGIGDQVVVCPHCFTCYELNLTPSAMTLLTDVTQRYPQLAARRTPAAPASDAIPIGAAAMAGVGPVSAAELAERPGCVTAYAVLLFIGAALITLGAIALAGGGDVGGLELVLLLAVAGAEIAIGAGLWRMKNWARGAALRRAGVGRRVQPDRTL